MLLLSLTTSLLLTGLPSGNTTHATDSLSLASEITEPRTQTFVVTAYYSPLPGQKRYFLGSYEDDIKLNGRGVHGASWEKVFPGMIAAPRSYQFGQYIDLGNAGVWKVSDRGGAIVSGSGKSADRLDIWMGYGDAGLTRAMAWGRKTVTGTVYPVGTKRELSIDFSKLYPNIQDTPIIVDPEEIKRQEAARIAYEKKKKEIDEKVESLDGLKIGSTQDEVIILQDALFGLGYMGQIPEKWKWKLTGTTRVALIRFQIEEKLIRSSRDVSAGIVWPRTQNALKKRLLASDIDFKSNPWQIASTDLSFRGNILLDDTSPK
jgi:hypothetical protein